MHLGYFSDFGGNPSLLLSGDRGEVDEFRAIVAGYLRSQDQLLAVHELPFVVPHLGATLTIIRDPDYLVSGFRWVCSHKQKGEIIEALLSLVAPDGPGHQYFDILPEGTDLIVSFGEWGEQLWTSAEATQSSV
jgi:hypothetical protein